MYYENYLNYVLDHNDLIYLDTSTIMNVETMRLFIQFAEDEFVARNKKMIVTRWVQKEINKHISSTNENKCKQARAAMLLLTQFESIFFLEEENDISDIATFADSDLLSRITLNKATATQLLITHDRALALDAYNLNKQGSNRGGKVMVCHINKMGFIKKCDCVSVQSETHEDSMVELEKETKERIVYVDRPVMNETYEHRKWWKTPVTIVSGIAGGIIFDRYAVPAIKKAIRAVA